MKQFFAFLTSKLGILAIATTLFSAACTDLEAPAPIVDNGKYGTGGFIVNEGQFGRSNGTISHYDFATRTLTNDIVGGQNTGFALGDVVQSLYFGSEKTAYAVVNNSNRIVILESNTFKFRDTMKGFDLPRYFYQPNAVFGMVSEWGANGLQGAVKIIDLNTKKVIKTIGTGKGADKMVQAGDFVYVLNADGFDVDSTVAVINLATQSVQTKLNVGKHPNSIEVDATGRVWVTSGSVWYPNDGAKLTKINGTTVEFSKNLPTPASNLTPTNGRSAFLMVQNNEVFSFPISGTATTDLTSYLRSNSFTNIYGMSVGKDGNLYVFDARTNNPSRMLIFDGVTKAPKDSLNVGFYANGMISK
ncbi:MAG: hypothetical protein RL757_378 [Bacteroidota bacterium]|jgi:hypothetical protein